MSIWVVGENLIVRCMKYMLDLKEIGKKHAKVGFMFFKSMKDPRQYLLSYTELWLVDAGWGV